jgi:hypothetical protein
MSAATQTVSMVIADQVSSLGETTNSVAAGTTLTIPSFESDFSVTPSPAIPEIDIKIESLSITATTRKLRARWSPELAQDLNAYHSMDAEVELTSILSEQIALEIDREILNDLVTEANGANMYWSRAPGKFVNKLTGHRSGAEPPSASARLHRHGPRVVRDLIETIIDVRQHDPPQDPPRLGQLHGHRPGRLPPSSSPQCSTSRSSRSTARARSGSPFTIGAEAIGTLSNRFTVYKDPYFPTEPHPRRVQGRQLPRDGLRLCSLRPADRHPDDLRSGGLHAS